MPPGPPDWKAFEDAQQALFASIRSVADGTTPSVASNNILYTPPILIHPPSLREEALDAHDLAEIYVAHVVGRLDDLMHEVEQLREKVMIPWSIRLAASRAPILALPHEILREIFLLLVPPASYAPSSQAHEDAALTTTSTLKTPPPLPLRLRTIFTLSHVCHVWREVIHSIGTFFTHPNFDSWPGWLVRDFCTRARAGGHPMYVRIGSVGLRRLCEPGQSTGDGFQKVSHLSRELEVEREEWREAVLGTRASWKELDLNNIGEWDLQMEYQDVLLGRGASSASGIESEDSSSLSNSPCVFSEMLKLRVAVDAMGSVIDIISENFPSVEELELSRVVLRLSGPLSCVEEASILPPDNTPWEKWTELLALSQLPSLISLTLKHIPEDSSPSWQLSNNTKINLPQLEILQLESIWETLAGRLLEFFNLPSLHTLRVVSISGNQKRRPALPQRSQVIHMPTIRTLQVVDVNDFVLSYLLRCWKLTTLEEMTLVMIGVNDKMNEFWELLVRIWASLWSTLHVIIIKCLSVRSIYILKNKTAPRLKSVTIRDTPSLGLIRRFLSSISRYSALSYLTMLETVELSVFDSERMQELYGQEYFEHQIQSLGKSLKSLFNHRNQWASFTTPGLVGKAEIAVMRGHIV
ncbi:hypothetical protein DL93DRAFT_2078254 [Clavulina sp. PMI_390]|nr:hypothetical protein DL93DRAFT_2078254 [Clavulina sp. PMI_390]